MLPLQQAREVRDSVIEYIKATFRFKEKVRDAQTLEANNIRQQLFDNLQPNFQNELQDIDERLKALIISADVYLPGVKELLLRYLSCNLSCNPKSSSIFKICLKTGD